jgi:hypothetical protein
LRRIFRASRSRQHLLWQEGHAPVGNIEQQRAARGMMRAITVLKRRDGDQGSGRPVFCLSDIKKRRNDASEEN